MRLLAVLMTLLAPSLATAGGAAVQLLDSAGAAVANAVIILEPLFATAPGAALPPRVTTATIDQRDLRFVPEISVVARGAAVSFPNHDRVKHQVYSFSPAKSFKLPLYAGTVHPPVIFETQGLVTLGCNIHDAMIGYVYVSDSPWFGLTTAEGKVDLAALPAGAWRVRAWHPRFREATPEITASIEVPANGTAQAQLKLTRAMLPVAVDNATRNWKGY